MNALYETGLRINQSYNAILKEEFKKAYIWIKNFDLQILKTYVNFTTTLAVANLILFINLNALGTLLEQRIYESPKLPDQKNRLFNLILIDVFIIGGLSCFFNYTLLKLCYREIPKSILVAYTLTHIFLRQFFHLPVPIKTPPKKFPKEPFTPEKKIEKVLSIPKIQASDPFIKTMINDMRNIIKKPSQYESLEGNQKKALLNVVEKMKEGFASYKGEWDLCHCINLSIQTSFEELLYTYIESGEIIQAKSLFLSDLPCPALMKERTMNPIDEPIEWKTWVLNIHTQTIRNLQAINVPLIVCYSQENLNHLKEDAPDIYTYYQSIKETKKLTDVPLAKRIPDDLLGSIYHFTNAEHKPYFLIIQNLKAKNEETSHQTVKVWLGPATDTKMRSKANEMLNFLKENHK